MTSTHGGSNRPKNWMKLLTASPFMFSLSPLVRAPTAAKRRNDVILTPCCDGESHLDAEATIRILYVYVNGARSMKTKLKQFRVRAGMTQATLAKKVGVTQPNYQRWESGSAPVPEDKLKKLAKVLKTTTEALLGRHPPIEARFYDDSAGDDVNYYGEVAIHFCGGGVPLLLSISEKAFSGLHD